MKSTLKRKMKELNDIKKSILPGITFNTVSDDLSEWKFTIEGPEGSFYENGVFNLCFKLPEEYPLKYPYVYFNPPLHHPQFDPKTGEVCNYTIYNWVPTSTIIKIVLQIQEMLSPTFMFDPLYTYNDIKDEYDHNKEIYAEKIKRCITMHARVLKA